MKKRFVLIGATSFALLLCSCGGGDNSSPSSTPAPSSSNPPSSTPAPSSSSQTSSPAQISSSQPQVVIEKPAGPTEKAFEADGIVVFVRSSYTHFYAWNGSQTISNPWPGTQLIRCSSSYSFAYLKGLESVNIIFNAGGDSSKTADLTVNGKGYHYYSGSAIVEENPFLSSFYTANYDPRNVEWTKPSYDDLVAESRNFDKSAYKTCVASISNWGEDSQQVLAGDSSEMKNYDLLKLFKEVEVFRCLDASFPARYVAQSPKSQLILPSVLYFDQNGVILEHDQYLGGRIVSKVAFAWSDQAQESSEQASSQGGGQQASSQNPIRTSSTAPSSWITKWDNDRILSNIPRPTTLGANVSFTPADSGFAGRAGAVFAGSQLSGMTSYISTLQSKGYTITANQSPYSWTLSNSKYIITLGRSDSNSTVLVVEK